MAQTPPGGIPGNTGTSTKYPQYGLNPSTGKTIVAHSTAEKLTAIKQGYVEWFFTQASAQSAYSAQQNPLSNGSLGLPNPLAGLAEIGAVLKAFFTTVADWHLWASLGWIALGLVLVVMGLRLWLGKPLLPAAPPIVPIPV